MACTEQTGGVDADAAPCHEGSDEKWPREIPLGPGIPSGWKCIEHKYQSGTKEGHTYTRYISPEGKQGFLSGQAVIKHDAETHGRDVEAALKAWEEVKAVALEKRKQDLERRMIEAAAAKKQKEEEEKAKNKESLKRMLTGQSKPATAASETCSGTSPAAPAQVNIQTPPRQLPRTADEARPSSHKRRVTAAPQEEAGQLSLLSLAKKRRETGSEVAELTPPQKEKDTEDSQLPARRDALKKELEKVRASKQAAVESEQYDTALQCKTQEEALMQQLQALDQASEDACSGAAVAKLPKEQPSAEKTAAPHSRADVCKAPKAIVLRASCEAASSQATGQLNSATLSELFQFLQCQLCMEAREVLDQQISLEDPGAKSLWEEYEAFVTPNLGKTERWVPYHTMFGVHELFLIQSVHHRQPQVWTEKQRFLSVFIFRAHCKRDFFNAAQLPHMLKEDFWTNPLDMFRNEGPLEQAMLNYRRKTKQPLLTLCFRMIPERTLKDDDENLVRSIVLRTQTLLTVAEEIWPILKNEKLGPAQKFKQMSSIVQGAPRLGETWAKMLMVCIDLAYPEEQLLNSQCEVGVGALPPLRALLPNGGAEQATRALQELTSDMNQASDVSAGHFWSLLPHVEELARKKFEGMPLIEKQACTKVGKLNNVTVQVQLCEYRQFRNFLARTRYGATVDETMKLPEKPRRSTARCGFNEERQCLEFEILLCDAEEGVAYEVPLAATKGRRRLAERVGMVCLQRFSHAGASSLPKKAEVEAYLKELYGHCDRIGKEDVPEDSEAWRLCRVNMHHPSPLCSFAFSPASGAKVAFQTTVKAVGGNMLECERVARLCWAKFEAGATREQVLAYRSELYEKSVAGVPTPSNQTVLTPVFKKQKVAN